MPYFFILPIYALLFGGLLMVSIALCFTKRFKHWSSYIAIGALGTFPGFIIGNILFWLVTWGLLTLFHKPMQQMTSDIAHGVETVAVVIFFIGGLSLANIGGCIAGFLGGVWIRSKFSKKRSM